MTTRTLATFVLATVGIAAGCSGSPPTVQCSASSECGTCRRCSSGGCVPDEACSADSGIPDATASDLCANGVKDPSETDVDCGRSCPTKCGDGKSCKIAGDCQSGMCLGGTCIECLTDGYKDGRESDVDCGAACLSKCEDGKHCTAAGDCLSGRMCFSTLCQPDCTVSNGGCDALTTCANTSSGRVCDACPSGYTGAGETGCVDIDECLTNNGGCDPLTTCTNTPGSRTCGACPSGYTGTGATGCADINECTAGTAHCPASTTCNNTPGSYTCPGIPVPLRFPLPRPLLQQLFECPRQLSLSFAWSLLPPLAPEIVLHLVIAGLTNVDECASLEVRLSDL